MRVMKFVLVLMLSANATCAEGQLPPDLRAPNLDQIRLEFDKQLTQQMKWQRGKAASTRDFVTWREILEGFTIAAGAYGVSRAARQVPNGARTTVNPWKTGPVVIVIGCTLACLGAGLYLFGMTALDQPFLPFVGVAVGVVGLGLCAVGLPRPNSDE